MQNILFDKDLIAPCGINCGVCIAYLREKKPCSGCRLKSNNKPKHCVTCKIANCDMLSATKTGFCIDCKIFPCQRIKRLDLKYRKNYQTSLIGNLELIKSDGILPFLQTESLKWLCPSCGMVLCIHRDSCLKCNTTT